MRSARSDFCRVLFIEVELVTRRVRRVRYSVGTCPAMSASCRDLFVEVVCVSVCVRRGRLSAQKCSEMWVIVGTCTTMYS